MAATAWLARLLVLVASVTATQSAKGQAPSVTVVVVHDSVAGAPLRGATVVVGPDGASAVTDSTGAATVTTAGRASRVVVYHDRFDRMGIGPLLAERLASDSGPRWDVSVATPSPRGLWDRWCADEPRPMQGRVVLGNARNETGQTHVAGAVVIAQWARPDSAGAMVTVRAVADTSGEFRLCGVPDDANVAVTARAGDRVSGNILLPPEDVPVQRLDMRLASAEERGDVFGTVVDDALRGVPAATVWVDGDSATAVTRADGTFLLRAVPAGTRSVGMRRVGYRMSVEHANVSARRTDTVRLVTGRVTTLDEVETRSTFRSRERRELDERRLSGQSQILDTLALAGFPQTRHALASLRGVEVRVDRRGDFALKGRLRGPARCNVFVYLDGIRYFTSEDSGPEMMRALQLEHLGAIEYFSSDAHAPARFRPLGDTCGVLLLWTRAALGMPAAK